MSILTHLISSWRLKKQHHHITLWDITIFFRQFATLIAADVPMVQSCDTLEKSQEKIALRLLIYSIKRDILAGKPLSHCLHRYPHYFDSLTQQLIKIGEHTGRLDNMLLIIADHLEKQLTFQKRLKQILFYPALILITALGITFSMFIFVIPHFASLFQDMQLSLPLITKIIFYFSMQLHDHLFVMLIISLLLASLCFHSSYAKLIKHTIKQIITHLPFIRVSLFKLKQARFIRQLALTLTAGLPITEALRLAGNTHQDLSFISAKVRSGLSLHRAMETFPQFPPFMIQMIKVGEESGKLEAMLAKLADFLESEAEQGLQQINQILEPLIIAVLGVLIGGLVIGMYLPIFKIGSRL